MMNTAAFRHLYEYHFTENRALWNVCAALSDEQFTQAIPYSHGSVRNQFVHLMSVDDTWFSGLRGSAIPEPLNPASFPDREGIRVYWDHVERTMRDYLAELRDDTLFDRPLEGEDKDLMVWQVLIHVVNHGTDHRAQVLRLLHDFGLKTTSQDYIFFVYDNP
ncbi:MAG: DinB family protein [Roseiflexus sp.]|jgi:uncharacterized damage-inducible protein DinB|uniref:DinB family protein n=1 Tax=Roseiflexus sp. TaxID=2562120 RepID=UPI0025E56A7D|nr:DinB family protein [Roseiflexus sp.]MCL6542291.1 DinB family protein [Roseiflexus sp.]